FTPKISANTIGLFCRRLLRDLQVGYEKSGLVVLDQPIPWNADAICVEIQVLSRPGARTNALPVARPRQALRTGPIHGRSADLAKQLGDLKDLVVEPAAKDILGALLRRYPRWDREVNGALRRKLNSPQTYSRPRVEEAAQTSRP